jgi:hypothetical protein
MIKQPTNPSEIDQSEFDYVKMMRDIRNNLDAQFSKMSWAEQQV